MHLRHWDILSQKGAIPLMSDRWGRILRQALTTNFKKTTKSREYDNLFLKSKSIFQNTVKTY